MKYFKIFVELLDWMEELTDEERGRLITAMLRYARDGEATGLIGSERFLWPVVRGQLDRAAEQYGKVCAANAANARKRSGGAPATSPPPGRRLLLFGRTGRTLSRTICSSRGHRLSKRPR